MSWMSKILRRTHRPRQKDGTSGSHQPARDESRRIAADNPIRNPEDDVLGRANLASSFSEQLLLLDVTEGVVVGVLGPWGSGKTSFINLARTRLESAGIAILDFNPWMFSGAEQLVESFFVELSAQLKVRPDFSELGSKLNDYGEIFSGMSWLPLVGPWMDRGRVAKNILAKILQRRKEGVGGRRLKVENALAAVDKPLVVVVDDIDRLTTSEIRDIFKVVRLIASFPNVIYITAFDRARVEEALAEQGIPGRHYLEKILQLTIDLPAVPAHVLNEQIFGAIEDVLSGMDNLGRFDDNVWPDVFFDVIRPLLRNIRDVRRYTTAIHWTVRNLNGQVALVDVLALEAVRLFLPDLFREMHQAIGALTATSNVGSGDPEEPSRFTEQVDGLIKVAGDHAGVARQFIQHLFPVGQRHIGGFLYGEECKLEWLKERRVAHEAVLRLYLERVIGEGLLAFTEAEQAWGLMADGAALDSYLRSLPAERLQDVISQLEAYEEQFAPEHVVTGSVVLLNLLTELPDRQRGMFDVEPSLVVRGVVYRLVRLLKAPDAIEAAVRRILPQLTKLSAKGKLITMVGHQAKVGQKLVSESAACGFEEAWRGEVRSATDDFLAAEDDLLWVLFVAKRDSGSDEPPLDVPDAPSVTRALLRSARSEALSQELGSRAVRRSPRLQWDMLVDLYGGEDILRERIEKLKIMQSKSTDDILELADRYLQGDVPSEDYDRLPSRSEPR